MIAINRLHDILKASSNIHIRTGSINSMIASMNEKLNSVLASIKTKVTNSKVSHFDETSVPANRKNHWIHCSSTPKFTHLTVEEKRGEKGIVFSGILPLYNGIPIHDC